MRSIVFAKNRRLNKPELSSGFIHLDTDVIQHKKKNFNPVGPQKSSVQRCRQPALKSEQTALGTLERRAWTTDYINPTLMFYFLFVVLYIKNPLEFSLTFFHALSCVTWSDGGFVLVSCSDSACQHYRPTIDFSCRGNHCTWTGVVYADMRRTWKPLFRLRN